LRLATYLMRLKPSICAFIGCWALALSFPLVAQEGKPQPDVETTGGLRTDPELIPTEPEGRNNKLPVSTVKEVVRDSVQTKTLKQPLKPVEKTEKEADPLSFNFLYYIIEKFKMSDIIE
jgi:hypothetical protein